MRENCRVPFFLAVVLLLACGMTSASARALSSPARSYAPPNKIEFAAYPACVDSLPPEMRNGLFVANNPINLTDPFGLWTYEAGITGSVGLAIIGGAFEVGIVFDSDGGLGLKGTLTGRVGPQLGADISPYAAGSTACDIDDLNGLSAGSFIDAWKLGSGSLEFAGANSEFGPSIPVISGQYSNLGPGFIVGAGAQVSTTGVWRWK